MLPDDNIVIVGSESLRCPEVRFPPSFTGKEANGIQDTTSQSSGSVTLTSEKTYELPDAVSVLSAASVSVASRCFPTQLQRKQGQRFQDTAHSSEGAASQVTRRSEQHSLEADRKCPESQRALTRKQLWQ